MRNCRRSLRIHPPEKAVEEHLRSGSAAAGVGAAGGEVGRRRRERRDFAIRSGIVLGRARARLPNEGDGAGGGAVVDAEGGFAREKLREQFVIFRRDFEGFLFAVD